MNQRIDKPVVSVANIRMRYRNKIALDNISVEIPAGKLVGLIGPDGVGKSSLLALIAGARVIQQGEVHTLGANMARERDSVCTRIAYMPQGLGKNLYPTLSIQENLEFFARLFGQDRTQRQQRIEMLTRSTGLHPFLDRPAGKLSGGMKQKLGLCAALIHDPDLLILDEPTTGVDPLARRQFWQLISTLRADHPGMSVIVATAYMDEAECFDHLIAMNAGRILASASPAELRRQTGSTSIDDAFIAMLPQSIRQQHVRIEKSPFQNDHTEIAIRAQNLTRRFGRFVAVDRVNLEIRRGEIFGFIGSNGCGKTTTIKMLTGLLTASEGSAELFGKQVDPNDLATRRRVGYMSQSFSLYRELTVRQNLVLHARLFGVADSIIDSRVSEVAARFDLQDSMDSLPNDLPLGIRQRLSLAVAMVHQPEMLILDEPTSGVDPIARDRFWQLLIELSRRDRVTIFVSTHFMNEAERCDRVALMHEGRILVTGAPEQLEQDQRVTTLDEAFIAYLQQSDSSRSSSIPKFSSVASSTEKPRRSFSLRRAYSYALRETLELTRDPVRAALALLGSIILLLIMGYGINMDVEELSYAVLDHDQTALSRDYTLNLSGSRYFSEREPIVDYADLDRRMRSGELSLAIEIPPGFARDLYRGDRVEIGAWVDGAMPQRAETARGYVLGLHQQWLQTLADLHGVKPVPLANIETRFRYNPEVRSMPAMVPAIMPMLLLMFPAMLAALSVVREKELGSIVNFYVTPVTRLEFLLGKQIPYVLLGLVNLILMTAVSVIVIGVPLKGNALTLFIGATLFVMFATGFGFFVSAFVKSQIAALFATMIGTIIPVVQYAGLINPVTSLEGIGASIGKIYPATHMLIISRGVFNKALGIGDLSAEFLMLLPSVPFILILAALALRRQER